MQEDSIVVYTLPNYEGNALNLNLYDSKSTSIIINSLSIPFGFKLTLFSDSNYTDVVAEFGTRSTYAESGYKPSCEKYPNFQVQFKSYIAQNYYSPVYPIGTICNPTEKVIFYSEPFFKGDIIFQAFINFHYKNVDLRNTNSIYVPNGCYVGFYNRPLSKIYHHVLYTKAPNETLIILENFKVGMAYPQQAIAPPSKNESNNFSLIIFLKYFLIALGALFIIVLSIYVYTEREQFLDINKYIPDIFIQTYSNQPYIFLVFIFFTLICIGTVILSLIAPYSYNDRFYMTFNDSLKKNYSRMNSLKTLVFLLLHICYYFLVSFLILYNQDNYYIISIICFFAACWILLFLYYINQKITTATMLQHF